MHRILLVAEIKGNKVYLGKLVTFFGKRGINLPPRPPRRFLYGGKLQSEIIGVLFIGMGMAFWIFLPVHFVINLQRKMQYDHMLQV